MKKLSLALLITGIFFSVVHAESFKLVTWNILGPNTQDVEAAGFTKGDYSRLNRVVQTLQHIDADVMCLQEVDAESKEKLEQAFSGEYHTNYMQKGENGGVLLLYKASKFTYLGDKNLSLNGTKDGQGRESTGAASYAELELKGANQRLLIGSVHISRATYDTETNNLNSQLQWKSLFESMYSGVINKFVQSIAENPIVLAGDFNTFKQEVIKHQVTSKSPTDDDVKKMGTLQYLNHIQYSVLYDKGLVAYAQPFSRMEFDGTTFRTKSALLANQDPTIDHVIFAGKINCRTASLTENFFAKAQWEDIPSDHRPVVAICELTATASSSGLTPPPAAKASRSTSASSTSQSTRLTTPDQYLKLFKKEHEKTVKETIANFPLYMLKQFITDFKISLDVRGSSQVIQHTTLTTLFNNFISEHRDDWKQLNIYYDTKTKISDYIVDQAEISLQALQASAQQAGLTPPPAATTQATSSIESMFSRYFEQDYGSQVSQLIEKMNLQQLKAESYMFKYDNIKHINTMKADPDTYKRYLSDYPLYALKEKFMKEKNIASMYSDEQYKNIESYINYDILEKLKARQKQLESQSQAQQPGLTPPPPAKASQSTLALGAPLKVEQYFDLFKNEKGEEVDRLIQNMTIEQVTMYMAYIENPVSLDFIEKGIIEKTPLYDCVNNFLKYCSDRGYEEKSVMSEQILEAMIGFKINRYVVTKLEQRENQLQRQPQQQPVSGSSFGSGVSFWAPGSTAQLVPPAATVGYAQPSNLEEIIDVIDVLKGSSSVRRAPVYVDPVILSRVEEPIKRAPSNAQGLYDVIDLIEDLKNPMQVGALGASESSSFVRHYMGPRRR